MDCNPLIARLGGDEFALLFPETGKEEVLKIVESLRRKLNRSLIKNMLPVTISVGAATTAGPVKDARSAVRKVDALMYQIKKSGKDGVLHKDIEGES